MQYPESLNELRVLPIRKKTDPADPIAWVVFMFLELLSYVSKWALKVYLDYKQPILGKLYYLGRRPSKSLEGHESVHDWQCQTSAFGVPVLRVIVYWIHYYLWPHGMRNLEVQAYAFEVARFDRDIDEATNHLAGGVYLFVTANRLKIRSMIHASAAEWRKI